MWSSFSLLLYWTKLLVNYVYQPTAAWAWHMERKILHSGIYIKFKYFQTKLQTVSKDMYIKKMKKISKLDGVGPVDNRPSTNKHHHVVHKKKNKKKMWHVTRDMCHVTRDMCHVTRDTWHVTCDTWHVTCDTLGGVNILSKFQLPSSYRLWFGILWRSGGKGSRTQWMN